MTQTRAPTEAGAAPERYRHKKRGTTYTLIGVARVQSDRRPGFSGRGGGPSSRMVASSSYHPPRRPSKPASASTM
ncbi:MAG: hypothetical protein FD152_2197 [Xanthobacteraceae bacterium]|nr:MAG: hypothetical protein FD152_2197 [Xanthobacteraceae bacterium]